MLLQITCLKRAEDMLQDKIIIVELDTEHQGVFAAITAKDSESEVEVVIDGCHDIISRIVLNGRTIVDEKKQAKHDTGHSELDDISLEGMYTFSCSADIDEIRFVLDSAVRNAAASAEGLAHSYGLNIGSTLMQLNSSTETHDNPLHYANIINAAAVTAAASDARMAGCCITVVTNSGSGNQGITASLPVYTIGKQVGENEEKLIRALTLSHLSAIYQKHFSDRLSSFCGAVTAAVGAGCGVTYLLGGGFPENEKTVNTALGGISGMFCDGAKSSCALKIAFAVQNSLISCALSLKGTGIPGGEGIISGKADRTIRDLGLITRRGMRKTDEDILQVMLNG